MPKIKPRTSRRVPTLKDSDFDHEIKLVDHSAPVPRNLSPDEEALRGSISEHFSTAGPSSNRPETPEADESGAEDQHGQYGHEDVEEYPGEPEAQQPSVADGPLVEVEQPTPIPNGEAQMSTLPRIRPRTQSPESAIDILYENQRGGFLCGMALFSSKALGNLDPAPWTNFAHKSSPTDIGTAQVPDPSWDWAWPEWKVNHDEGADADAGGWEYSFMFARKFSWHGPRWWNSFVRRRAWIRRRTKTDVPYLAQDPLMLNPEYFSVRPVSAAGSHSRSSSREENRRESKISTITSVIDEVDEDGLEKPVIDDIVSLMVELRTSRIDREKIEAVDNFLEHAGEDLAELEALMHEIMALFVFQASRRVLLTRLTEVYDETQRQLKKGKGAKDDLQRRIDCLAEAIKHADEEVRRLEYWSDIKGMVEAGESRGAMDKAKGWNKTWGGIDQSGPAHPEPGEAKS